MTRILRRPRLDFLTNIEELPLEEQRWRMAVERAQTLDGALTILSAKELARLADLKWRIDTRKTSEMIPNHAFDDSRTDADGEPFCRYPGCVATASQHDPKAPDVDEQKALNEKAEGIADYYGDQDDEEEPYP
jgi:hypothetical protein